MKDAISQLFGSRKFILVCLATIVVAVLAAIGKLPVTDVISTIEKLTMVLTGALAIEGAAEKWGTSVQPPPPSVVVQTIPPPPAPPNIANDNRGMP